MPPVHYEYKYDEHEPWKVERIRRVLQQMRRNEADTEEMKLFRATHPKLATMALQPESAEILEVMLHARSQIENGTMTTDDANVHIQVTLFEENRKRAAAGTATAAAGTAAAAAGTTTERLQKTPPVPPPSPPKIEEVDE